MSTMSNYFILYKPIILVGVMGESEALSKEHWAKDGNTHWMGRQTFITANIFTGF